MSPLLDSRDLNHRRRNGTTTPTGSEIFPREPSEHALGCQNVVQPAVQPYRPAFRPAFVDDVIQGGLPYFLLVNYFFLHCHSVQVEIYSLWIRRMEMLSTLSISSSANLNLFFRFGLFENLSERGQIGENIAAAALNSLQELFEIGIHF